MGSVLFPAEGGGVFGCARYRCLLEKQEALVENRQRVGGELWIHPIQIVWGRLDKARRGMSYRQASCTVVLMSQQGCFILFVLTWIVNSGCDGISGESISSVGFCGKMAAKSDGRRLTDCTGNHSKEYFNASLYQLFCSLIDLFRGDGLAAILGRV